MKNNQNLNAYKKGHIDYCLQTLPSLKTVCPLTNGFSQFFLKMLFFSKNLFNNKISVRYLIRDKKKVILLIFYLRHPISL